jgi:hypothetical protein
MAPTITALSNLAVSPPATSTQTKNADKSNQLDWLLPIAGVAGIALAGGSSIFDHKVKSDPVMKALFTQQKEIGDLQEKVHDTQWTHRTALMNFANKFIPNVGPGYNAGFEPHKYFEKLDQLADQKNMQFNQEVYSVLDRIKHFRDSEPVRNNDALFERLSTLTKDTKQKLQAKPLQMEPLRDYPDIIQHYKAQLDRKKLLTQMVNMFDGNEITQHIAQAEEQKKEAGYGRYNSPGTSIKKDLAELSAQYTGEFNTTRTHYKAVSDSKRELVKADKVLTRASATLPKHHQQMTQSFENKRKWAKTGQKAGAGIALTSLVGWGAYQWWQGQQRNVSTNPS